MKLKISAASFTALSVFLQAFCTKVGEDYELDTARIEDPAKLKQAKDRERDEHNATKKELADLRAEHTTTVDDLAKYQGLAKGTIPKANLEALEKSWGDKLTAAEAKAAAESNRLNGTLQRLLVDKEAQSIAAEISTSPSLLIPHIKALLSAEIDSEGNAHTRVLKDGKPSAMTLDDLKKDLIANKEFAPIIKGTKSRGSSASGDNPGSRAPGGDKFNLNTAPAKDLVAFLESKGVGQEASGGE